MAPVNPVLGRNLIWLGLVALFALAVAWFGGDLFVVRPVRNLQGVTDRLGAGDLTVRAGPECTVGELGLLAHSFDQMANSLQEREEALRESEERLRRLGDNLPESAVYQYFHEPDGRVRFFYMSAGIEQLNGVRAEEVVRDAGTLHRQILPEYYGRLLEAEATSAHDLSDFDMEVPMRRPDGQVRWMQLHSRPRRLEDGRIVWDGVQTDITDRKRAEAEVKRLASFPQMNPSPVLEVDLSGAVTFSNQTALEALEKLGPEAELGGLIPEDLGEIITAVREKQEKLFFREVRIKDQVFGQNIYFAEPYQVLRIYSMDITDRKVAEEALRRLNEDLEQRVEARTEELQETVAQLEKEIAERRRVEEALTVSNRVLEIVNRHDKLPGLLKEFVAETKNFFRCEAVGIRLLDEEGNIPYHGYVGFTKEFYEMESPLSIKSDQCMRINVVKGTTDPKMPFYTPGGSFYMNGTTRFLATVSEEDKGASRNVCNATGYESVALVPIRLGQQILGLIHLADRREDMVPRERVELLETVALQLATAFQRAQAQETIRKQADLIDLAHDAIIVRDLDSRIVFWSRGAAETYGFSAEHVRGHVTHDLLRTKFPTSLDEIQGELAMGRG